MAKTVAAKAGNRKPRAVKNPNIASATIEPNKPRAVPFNEEQADKKDVREQAKMDAKIERNQSFKSLPEEVAQSKFYYKNWLWDQGGKFFQWNPRLKHVDFYFPDAEGGPLLVDCFQREPDAKEAAEQKAPAIAKAGFRYVCLTYGMGIDEAMEQLHRCDNSLKKGKK